MWSLDSYDRVVVKLAVVGIECQHRHHSREDTTNMAEATLTKVSIQPLGDRVLVQPLEKDEIKKG